MLVHYLNMIHRAIRCRLISTKHERWKYKKTQPPTWIEPVRFHPLPSPLPNTPSNVIMKTTHPEYVCYCTSFGCSSTQHQVAGIGVVPGRVLSRQAHQEHQRREALLKTRAVLAVPLQQISEIGSSEVSSLNSPSKWEEILIRCEYTVQLIHSESAIHFSCSP